MNKRSKRKQDFMFKMFTIQDLLDKIKKEKLDTSLPIAVIGHYGEIHPLDKYDFRVTKGRFDITSNIGLSHSSEIEVLQIDPPNIGPEPD